MTDSPDTSSYSTVNQLNAEKADREVVDGTLQKLIEIETRDRAAGDDALSKELGDLQTGFDTAVLAAQEGADNLNIELQSYLKKDDAKTSYLSLNGGELTNTLTAKLVKSIRNTGYAFEAKPDNATTTAFIRTDGSAGFSGNVKVDGTELAKVNHTHHWSDISSKPATYPPSGHSHDGYASSSHSHSNMAILKKGTSTNPSLSQGEMYLNTSQKILYIGV